MGLGAAAASASAAGGDGAGRGAEEDPEAAAEEHGEQAAGWGAAGTREPPRARCWQALGSGAARSSLSLAFLLPPLCSPLPLLPPPSWTSRPAAALRDGRGTAETLREEGRRGRGRMAPRSAEPERPTRPPSAEVTGREEARVLPPAPGLGVGAPECPRAWAWRGVWDQLLLICFLFTRDVHLSPLWSRPSETQFLPWW